MGNRLWRQFSRLKALKRLGLNRSLRLALAFVADEEQGSGYGIEYLMD